VSTSISRFRPNNRFNTIKLGRPLKRQNHQYTLQIICIQ
jgi:hypothetical protein